MRSWLSLKRQLLFLVIPNLVIIHIKNTADIEFL